MFLWTIFGIIVVITVVIIILPVIKMNENTPARKDFDQMVYRDQLAELNKDLERGLLSENELEAARTEVSRRILKSENEKPEEVVPKSQNLKILITSIVAVSIPLVSMNIYLIIGNPNLENQPFAIKSDLQKISQNNRTNNSEKTLDLEASINNLKIRLRENKNDLEGWILLGRSYLVTQKPNLAIEAFKKALELDPKNIEINAFIGEAIVFSANGKVTEEAKQAFQHALSDDNINPASLYYLALFEAQNGNLKKAFDQWVSLAAITPPDAPWYPMLRRQIVDTSKTLGINLDKFNVSKSTDNNLNATSIKEKGPTKEDIEAAKNMSEKDRSDMIRGMVEGLANRLKENPNDVSGWEKLIRAYRVLGETQKAKQAEQELKKVLSGN